MDLVRADLDPFLLFSAVTGLGGAVAAAVNVRRPFDGELFPTNLVQLAGIFIAASIAGLAIGGQPLAVVVAVLVATLLLIAAKVGLPQLGIAGAAQAASGVMTLLVGGPWSLLLLVELGFPGWTVALAALGMIVGVGAFALRFAGNLATQALLTHQSWQGPIAPLRPYAAPAAPKVSIHLPCHSEPPELVIATIDRIAQLDYENYELLVCDNNTADESLWRPVEAHIRWLNERHRTDRFRFFHVRPIEGAKAGALNFLRPHTAPDAELIAVIDADYLAEPDFLSRLVGFFDDPAVGYVQTPHDYREAEASAYMRACYWEYMPNNKIDMVGTSDYGAAFTIGTMCILRTKALDAVGGWAEWCLTEDSEVSVRIRALGWGGYYLRQTFGRGLIPETFEDYKKQRFRWTAGPVQQLRRYWRLYLPAPFGTPSALSGWSKLLEFQRSVAPAAAAATAATGLLAAPLIAFFTSAGGLPPFEMPAAGWAALFVGLARALVVTGHRYWLSGCRRVSDMVLGELARMSLAWVTIVGGVAGLSRRPLAWRRTPKFTPQGSGWRALSATVPETAIAIAHLVLLHQLLIAPGLGGDLRLLMVAGVAASALRFVAAPVMALLGEEAIATARRAAEADREEPLGALAERA